MDGMLVVTPARLYYSPVGTDRPSPNLLPGATWPAGWTEVGFTLTPTVIGYDPGLYTAFAEQHLPGLSRFKVKLGTQLLTTLAEHQVGNLNLAWDGTASSSTDLEEFAVGDYRFLRELQWGIEGEAPNDSGVLCPVRFYIPRATAILGGEIGYALRDVAGVPLRIAALASVGAPAVIVDPMEIVEVFAATIDYGVHHTYTWSFAGLEQPVWTPINDGLPYNAPGLRQFQCDPHDRRGRQLALLNRNDRELWMRIAGDSPEWRCILTAAAARELAGQASGWLNTFGLNYDQAGTIYVSFSTPITTGGTWILRSPDYGSNWTALPFKLGTYDYGYGGIVGYGPLVYAGHNYGVGGAGQLFVSSNNAETWIDMIYLGQSSWSVPIREAVNLDRTRIYTTGFDNAYYAVRGDDYGHTVVTPANGGSMHETFDGNPAEYPLSPLSLRKVLPSTLYRTADGWETIEAAALPVTVSESGVRVVANASGQLGIGRTGHSPDGSKRIVWGTDDDGVSLWHKAGSNFDRADLGYADSIPGDAAGLCWRGLEFVTQGQLQ